MQLVQIPKENIEEVWPIVVKDIADALARSNGYALADHIKKWIPMRLRYCDHNVS